MRLFLCHALLCLLLVGCKSEVDGLFLQADSARAAGQNQEALKIYEKIIAKDSASAEARKAYLQMGNVYFHGLNDPKTAISIFRDFAERGQRGPEVFEARRRLAEIFFSYLRDYRQAIQEYQRLLQDYPKNKEAASFQMVIGDCYFELNDFNQARIEFRDFIAKYPKNENVDRALFRIGESFYMEGRCKEAIAAYEEVLAKYSQSSLRVRAQFGTANCFEEQGNYKKALQTYQEIEPNYPSKAVVRLKIDNLKDRLEHLGHEAPAKDLVEE